MTALRSPIVLICPRCYRCWKATPEREETDFTVTYHVTLCPHCGGSGRPVVDETEVR